MDRMGRDRNRDRNDYSNSNYPYSSNKMRYAPQMQSQQNSNRSQIPPMDAYEVGHNSNNNRSKILNYAKNYAKRKHPYVSTRNRNDDKFSQPRSNNSTTKVKHNKFKPKNQASTSAGPSKESQNISKSPNMPLKLSDVSSDEDEASVNKKKKEDELNQFKYKYEVATSENLHLKSLLKIESECCENLKDEVNQLKNIQKATSLENEDLKVQLEKAEQEKFKIKADNDVISKNFQIELENKNSIIEKLTSKLHFIDDEKKNLKRNLDEESRLNYKLQKEGALLESKISREKEREIMDLKVKHGEFMTKLRIEKDGEIEKLKRLQLEKDQDKQYTSSQIERIMKDLNASRKEVDTLKTLNSKLQNENGKLKIESESRANEIIEMKNQYDKRLGKSQSQYQRAIDELEKKVKENETRLKSLINELKGEKQKVENLNQENINLKKENKKVEGYKKSLKLKSDENKKLKKEAKDLQDKLFIETKENERLQCKIRQLGEENNKKNSEIQDFKDDCLKRFDKLLPKPIEIE